MHRRNVSIGNDRRKRRNYIFELKVKFHAGGGLECDWAQAPCDYHLCFSGGGGNRRCCNCLPGLSVRIKQWNFNNDASSQALETPEAAKAVLESSQQGSGVGAASSASKLGVGL